MANRGRLLDIDHWLGLGVGLVLLLVSPAASAGQLTGRLTDAATGAAIAGARVDVDNSARHTRTDAGGYYQIELPDGRYRLIFEAHLGPHVVRSQLVDQRVPQPHRRPARPHLYTRYFVDQGISRQPNAPGLPSFSGTPPPAGPPTIDLHGGGIDEPILAPPGPTRLSLPEPIPTTIRVGFRQDETGADGCSDATNPIVDIQEMSLDEYVKGVLPAEIGVFRYLPNISETYKAFGIAAKSYALYFMLYYDAGNRRRLDRTVNGYAWFHIDNTACNQRYSDNRLPSTTAAAEAVAGKILVDQSSAGDGISKYEYAASCGGHGTRPTHQTAIVSDAPPTDVCVGDWCGHASCAGHQDNPDVAGADRCLVRGICQWGAAGWAKASKDFEWMLAHYQPNLEVRDLGPTVPPDPGADAGVPSDAGLPPDTGLPADAGAHLDAGRPPDDATVADIGPSTDIPNIPADSGRLDAPPDTSRRQRARQAHSALGPLVRPSRGTRAGCTTGGRRPPAPVVVLGVLVGLVWSRRVWSRRVW